MLGSFIQGLHVEGRQFVGSALDCFTAFSIFTGLALMFGYALLGAGWLVIKTKGPLQDWARALGRGCLIGTALGIAVVSLWTPLAYPQIAARWFSWPNIAFLAPVPLITLGLIWYAWRSLNDQSEYTPFLSALGLFVMSYLGIAISLWPMIVPWHFTLDQAASSQSTQAFLLIGTLLLLPVILLYTGWSYWVFRGKARADIGYH
jgi:cytochrome d ubiquinol oxidase subunit II